MEDLSGGYLTTEYEDRLDKASVHSYYPRPSMVRDSFLSLNGEWELSVCREGEEPEYLDRILVPFPLESRLSGYGKCVSKGSVIHYRRKVRLPLELRGGTLLLHFGAVDTLCRVAVNGRTVGEHEGGYLPFSCDITEAVGCEDEFLLSVTVRDELDKKYPYGKQRRDRGGMWYTPVSGIWQSVWLERVPEVYVERLKITPTVDYATVEVFGGREEKLLILEDGREYRFTGNSVNVSPIDPICWTPENPHLYRFTLKSGEDEVRSYFALREVGCASFDGVPRLTLNGEPYLFNGLLDQGYYPDGIFLPATEDGYRDDILRMKELGFNTLRKHIKIEPEIFYYLCDTLGMAVFQDAVNNSDYSFLLDTALPTVGLKRMPDKFRHKSEENRKEFIKTMLGMMEHLYNFPSVVYYTVFNEGWGQFCADECYRLAKNADGTRIIDATSGWFTQKESDVDSRHIYFKKIKMGKASSRPIVISEFGGYSYRVEGHLFGEDNYGYRNMKTREELEDCFVRLYEDEIEPLIPLGISALIYTQLSDVEDETNGILTYDRRVRKLDAGRIRPLMERLNKLVKEQK